MIEALVLSRSEALLAEPKLIGSLTLDLTLRENPKQWDSALDSSAAGPARSVHSNRSMGRSENAIVCEWAKSALTSPLTRICQVWRRWSVVTPVLKKLRGSDVELKII